MHRAVTVLLIVVSMVVVAGCVATTPPPTVSVQRGTPSTIKPSAEIESKPLEISLAQYRSTDEQLAALERLVAETRVSPLLGKGDILSVSVYDEPELTLTGVPVRPDGMISYPLIGDVQAEARSVEELTTEISNRLREFVLEPRVSVIVTAFNSLSYVINGEVVKPGIYPLVTDVSITAAVAAAGGLKQGQLRATSVELADLSRAFLARQGKLLPVDFVSLMRHGDLRFDIPLQSGDYISIPSGLSKEVFVLGEIQTPGLFAFRGDMTMSRTLALAESFTKDADLSRIHVIRGSLSNPTLIIADFKKVIAGQQQDVRLEPGDLVYVPPTGLSSWARMLNQIVPTITGIQTGIILRNTVRTSN